jgi:Domain of unknown function (DUF4190)
MSSPHEDESPENLSSPAFPAYPQSQQHPDQQYPGQVYPSQPPYQNQPFQSQSFPNQPYPNPNQAYPNQPYPPYPYPPYPGYRPGTNGFAIAALVCSFFSIVGGILGIVFGSVALGQIRERGQSGRGMAIAGIVIGSCWVCFFLIGLVVGLSTST